MYYSLDGRSSSSEGSLSARVIQWPRQDPSWLQQRHSSSCSSSSFHLSDLLNHRAARVGRARCVVMRLARFVREKPALAGCAHLVGNSGDGVRTDRSVHLLARCVGKGIATLTSSGEGLVNRLLTAALRRTA